MRILVMLIVAKLVVAAIPAAAQRPAVQLTNSTYPGATDFQIGDRFEVVITGAAEQPVSVRTTMHGRTDWGPVIGRTDIGGRWSTSGKFTKTDYGDWSEAWTVGGKLADPVVQFSVKAPCLKGANVIVVSHFVAETCETVEGRLTFATPSDSEPFRTPDGRMAPGRVRSNMTAEQYQTEIMEYWIANCMGDGRRHQFGDEAATLITKIIGVNSLSEEETRHVLSIIRAAYGKLELIPPAARTPSATSSLLQNLADATDKESLKKQIAQTMAFVQ